MQKLVNWVDDICTNVYKVKVSCIKKFLRIKIKKDNHKK